jgi:DNA polymerase III delta subunit
MAKKPSKSAEPSLVSGSESPRIAILHGSEAFIRSLETQKIREQLIKRHGEVESFVFDGADTEAALVLDECRSFGLMATHKLVIVDNAANLVKEHTRPLFEKYAQQPVESATLVLRDDHWHAGKLDKFVEAVGVVIKCDQRKPDEAIPWIIAHAKAVHSTVIDKEIATLLVSRVGSSYGKLDREVAKLAAAAGVDEAGKPLPITRELVAQFVGISREEAAWGIQSSLLSGDASRSLAHLRHILDISRQPPPLVMFAMLDLARKLHGVSAGSKAGTEMSLLSKSLKIWGDGQYLLVETARRLHPRDTFAFYQAAVEADRRSKSGFGEFDRSMEMLVVRLSRLLQPGR